MQPRLLLSIAIFCLASSCAWAGFDINARVTHLGSLDQIDIYFLNRVSGTYSDPFPDTGTGFFGASLDFQIASGHRAYFKVNRVEFGDKVDFTNVGDDPTKGWLRVGDVSMTRTSLANPSPNAFPFGTNPYSFGVEVFYVGFGYLGSPEGTPANAGLGAHAIRLVVDQNSEIQISGGITGSNSLFAIIPESSPYRISTIPEPAAGLILAAAVSVLRSRREPGRIRSTFPTD